MFAAENCDHHSSSEAAVPASAHLHWYAVQTCSRHEKRVHTRLTEQGIDSFLPLYETRHRWKDRSVDVQLPLFPGYIFLHLDLTNRLSVLQTSGVVRFVGFGTTATPLPPEEIVSLRQGLSSALQPEPHPYLRLGQKARVKSGPLNGIEGVLLRKKNKDRFVISLDLIMRSVAVDISALDLEPIETPALCGWK